MVSGQSPLESDVRAAILDLMPLEHAPAHVRLAFHDAGTYDRHTGTGGAHGTIRLPDELWRAANTGWGPACLDLLAEVKAVYPSVSWADLIAIGGAAAVQKCGGPTIEVGLGRVDSEVPAPPHRLPGGYEGSAMLKRIFDRMGLSTRDLVALSGAHGLGHTQRRPFTPRPWEFSNLYFRQLAARAEPSFLPTDNVLLDDQELFQYVELYAEDEQRFFADFGSAYRRMTWLGNTEPLVATSV